MMINNWTKKISRIYIVVISGSKWNCAVRGRNQARLFPTCHWLFPTCHIFSWVPQMPLTALFHLLAFTSHRGTLTVRPKWRTVNVCICSVITVVNIYGPGWTNCVPFNNDLSGNAHPKSLENNFPCGKQMMRHSARSATHWHEDSVSGIKPNFLTKRFQTCSKLPPRC